MLDELHLFQLYKIVKHSANVHFNNILLEIEMYENFNEVIWKTLTLKGKLVNVESLSSNLIISPSLFRKCLNTLW